MSVAVSADGPNGAQKAKKRTTPSELAATHSASEGPRRVSILGSTGSVGANTLDLMARNPDQFDIVALTASRNLNALINQARRFQPEIAVIADENLYDDLKSALSDTGIEVAAGSQAVEEAAHRPADWSMAAIVGTAGLKPTLAAAAQGNIVALANKECLVCAGDVLLEQVAKATGTLLPVDSEHNAIFQVFDFEQPETIEQIILTASGGPFRDCTLAEMAEMTPAQALRHPNWRMGRKISVDSATMMNKGLEIIEAFYLFPITAEQISVLVHPQSIVHSMVSYVDGSVLAQLGTPDMRTPIGYALGWPERMPTPSRKLNLAEIGQLNFSAPDENRFPALRLARESLAAGAGAATTLNAANEIAVEAFLNGRISFLEITAVTECTLEMMQARNNSVRTCSSLEDVIAIDREARRLAEGNVVRTPIQGYSLVNT